MVFRLAATGKAPALWLRLLDSLTARPLAGTDNGDFPFWSSDSRSLAFYVGGKLKRIDPLADDASPMVICDASDLDRSVTGGAWSREGVILIGSPEGLHRAPASGGPAQLIAAVDPGAQETGYGSPQFLPGQDRFIFFVRSPCYPRHITTSAT